DETQTVVSKGLEAPERVVTTGFVRLTDGTKVAIGSGDAAAQPAGQRPQGQGGARRQRGGGAAKPNTQQ
ncbi:MAG TPA: efflux RND transporter periplasmic adaptor subunit, partial [Pseudolabrys sp.]|nr:efflux RND transporter periplasmic adaptor subunit [Pseudolabrys sp.]